MKQYQVTSPITLASGRVKLDDKQAAAHAYALEKTSKKGIYKVVASTSFKAGEVIGLDEDLPKAVTICLKDPLDEDEDSSSSNSSGTSSAFGTSSDDSSTTSTSGDSTGGAAA